jgi:hypothetical protein
MKHYWILLLFVLYSTVTAFSQGILQEFIVEEDTPPRVPEIFKDYGCTPEDGVIVFSTTIPDLEFSIPDAPNRLKHVSHKDKKRYVLCVQPTDGIGGYTKYAIVVNGRNYKQDAIYVSDIKPVQTHYFMITPKLSKEAKELNFVFRGIKEKTVKVFLDKQLIGETNFNRGFQLKYIDSKLSAHELRIEWTNLEWNGIINTVEQTDFRFEYKKKKTGFGIQSYFELVN